MKKLLFILPNYGFGGTVMSTYNMLSFLSKQEYSISIYTLSNNGPWKDMYDKFTILPESYFVKAICSSRKPYNNPFQNCGIWALKLIKGITRSWGKYSFESLCYQLTAKKIMKMHHFDVVASCVEGPSTQFASYFVGAKRVAWFRTEYSVYKNIIPRYKVKEEQIIYSRFDFIVCVSKTTRDDFASYFPTINENSIVAIHNIQDVETIYRKSQIKVEDTFRNEPFTLISVGRIAKQKQFHKIPEIAYTLHEKMKLDFKWYILGDGNVLGEKDRLDAEMEKYDCGDYVICIGSRKNPYPYIAAANILVCPSYYEACPRVVAEAKILHTPVVCADFSSANEFVEEGVTGFVRPIDQIWDILGKIISDKNFYSSVRFNCSQYRIDNDKLLHELRTVFD